MASGRGVVAVLGAGLMGSAAAARLAEAGFSVVVWSRTRAKAERAAGEAGGRVAGSVEEAVQGADYALAFVADDEALMAVAARVPRSDGLVFINASTVTPQAAAAVAGHLESKGVCYVEAPVLGGPGRVREGRVITLAAGRRVCRAAARPVLDALAEDVVEVGEDPAAAAALKLSYNSLLLSTVAALAESIALAEAYGVPPELHRAVLGKTVFSAIAEKYHERLRSPEWPLGFRVELAAKDLDYARRALWARGRPAPVASAAGEAYKVAAHSLGLAGLDYSRVARLYGLARPRGAGGR